MIGNNGAKDAGAEKQGSGRYRMSNTVRRLSGWAIVVAAILMVPLVADAPWTGSDFVLAAVLLFGSATVYELATRGMTNPVHRVAVGCLVAAVLAFIWVAAATGFERFLG